MIATFHQVITLLMENAITLRAKGPGQSQALNSVSDVIANPAYLAG
jgi:hypothetical protein